MTRPMACVAAIPVAEGWTVTTAAVDEFGRVNRDSASRIPFWIYRRARSVEKCGLATEAIARSIALEIVRQLQAWGWQVFDHNKEEYPKCTTTTS